MFALLAAVPLPNALYTHINLSNGNAASYPGPGCVSRAALIPCCVAPIFCFGSACACLLVAQESPWLPVGQLGTDRARVSPYARGFSTCLRGRTDRLRV